MTDLEEVVPTVPDDRRSNVPVDALPVARGADATPPSAPSILRCAACNAVSETVLCATCAGELETLIEAAQGLATRAHCAAKAGGLVGVRDWSNTMDECAVMLTQLAGQIGRGATRLSAPPSAPAPEVLNALAPSVIAALAQSFADCVALIPVESQDSQWYGALTKRADHLARAVEALARDNERLRTLPSSPAPSAPDLSEFDRLLNNYVSAYVSDDYPQSSEDKAYVALRSWVATALADADLTARYESDLAEQAIQAMKAADSRLALVTADTERLEGLAYAPGDWICDTCGYVESKRVLYARTGNVDASAATALPCPNDGTALRRWTWRECAKAAQARAMEEINRRSGEGPE